MIRLFDHYDQDTVVSDCLNFSGDMFFDHLGSVLQETIVMRVLKWSIFFYHNYFVIIFLPSVCKESRAMTVIAEYSELFSTESKMG